MTPKQAEPIFVRLERLQRKFGDAISRYSHAAANADMVRIAAERDRRIPADVADRAFARAKREEGKALDELLTEIDTTTDPELARIRDLFAAEGVTVDVMSAGTGRYWRDRIITYLTYVGMTIQRPDAAVYAEMRAAFAAEMRSIGLVV